MNAITTKFLGTTKTKGPRTKAYANGESVTVPWDVNQTAVTNYRNAAFAFCKKIGWLGTLVGGATKEGFVWVFSDVPDRFSTPFTWGNG